MRPNIVNLRTLLDKYEMILFDAYGVLVEETGALRGAGQLISLLNHVQKPYLVLTNGSSRTLKEYAESYKAVGLDITSDKIITSASVLTTYYAEHKLQGIRSAVLGTEGSRCQVKEAGGVVVDPLKSDDYEVLVIANQTEFPFLESIDRVLSTLFSRWDKDEYIKLILTNPDFIYPKGNGNFGITAGAIAAVLEQSLEIRFGRRPENFFVKLGKPFTPIFLEAFRRSQTMSMIMIGDQLETDIKGARNFGISSALFTGGVTNAAKIIFSEQNQPDYLLTTLDCN